MDNNKPATKNKAFLERIRKGKASVTTRSSTDKINRAVNKKSRPKLLFSMDATASREHSWLIAQDITSSMFDEVPGELDVALAYHGGGILKNVSPFKSNAKQFKDAVSVVRCDAGPTALNAILQEASEVNGLKAMIYIGDCYEEPFVEAEYYARQLKLKGTRAFMFGNSK
ncbi:MAG: hypothetical protein HRU09_16405 [Oligoflexales bacterium]|nr:hypothetical protein [Oligoflexales bacterium]